MSVASVEQMPSAVVVRVLARQLGKSEVDALCNSTDEARANAPALPFVIDMRDVDHAGSLAMGVLVGLNKEFRGRGQRLIFAGLQENVRKAFLTMHLGKVLEFATNVPAALQSVQGSATV